uniref:G-protein coupled receptors family 1 profile domain-containing protein n=1 Tax=Magallana gigas TaxID=29159 RepID=A0A8W8P5E0_MAGGI
MFPNSTVAIRDVNQFPDFVKQLFVIAVSISVLGLIGNLATILKIALDKKLHTPTFLAISSLAISEFIYLFTSIVYQLQLFFQLNSIPLSVSAFINGLSGINSTCDVVFLFFLRYALIVHPLKCRQYLTNSLVISVSLALWGYSIVFLILSLFVSLLVIFGNYDVSQIVTILTLMWTAVLVILPVTVITILHCLKIRRLRSSTVNPAISRKMSWIISIICVLYGAFSVCSMLVIWKTTFAYVANVLLVLVHSCNPYILFLFHVPPRRFCMPWNRSSLFFFKKELFSLYVNDTNMIQLL